MGGTITLGFRRLRRDRRQLLSPAAAAQMDLREAEGIELGCGALALLLRSAGRLAAQLFRCPFRPVPVDVVG
jgi:hypothetical protein